MAITILPSEVLENIFRFLDGQSFCRARRVCKAWELIIKGMQIKKGLWKEFCLREISQNVLKEILWFKSPTSCDIHMDWMNVYKKWFQSRMISKTPYLKKIQLFYPNPVSCIGISGSWILTGHSNGLLCVWNAQSSVLQQNFMCHLQIINDLTFVDLLNLGSYYGSEELPFSHHHVITVSKDRYINVTSLLEPVRFNDSNIHLKCHGDDLKKVIVFGDSFAVSSRDNTVFLWKMEVSKTPYFHLKVSFFQTIIGPRDIMLSLGFWHSEVQCVSYAGKLKILSHEEFDWIEKKYFKDSYKGNCVENIVAVTGAFLHRGETVIMLTADGKMIISVNEEHNRHYYMMKILQTVVVSVAFHGRILALGGENGKLFLYHVSSEEELIKLDFSHPDLTLTLSEASIIFIDISYQYDSPVVAAATTDFIYVIKWHWPSSCHQVVKKRDISHLFK